MESRLDAVIQRAHELVSQWSPRAEYAHDVLDGRQRWSGADLAGMARKYSASYARGRRLALAALTGAGGCVVPVEHGRRVSAVEVEPGLFMTDDGVYQRVEGRKVLARVAKEVER